MSWIEVTVHKSLPIAWWMKQYRHGRMNMQPGFQRRSNLWGRWKKAHLIDSIINGFDLPKFYVSDANASSYTVTEDEAPYAVIDGKQRFEALFEFLSGEIKLNATSIYRADPSKHVAGLDYFELRERHPIIASRVEEFEPVVMSVATDSTGLIEEMFVRLNSGVSINGAERRNAMPGPIPPIVRDITVHPFFGERVGFSKDRMQEFNLAAKLLMFEYLDELADTKAKNLDQFVAEADKATTDAVRKLGVAEASGNRNKIRAANLELDELIQPYKDAEERVMSTLDIMTEIFQPHDRLLSKQGVIPVYYWLLRNEQKIRGKFRDFLRDFDPAVLAHVRLARTDTDKADPKLLSYYAAVRTSNDKSSMIQRYNMLKDFYREWRRNRTAFELR